MSEQKPPSDSLEEKESPPIEEGAGKPADAEFPVIAGRHTVRLDRPLPELNSSVADAFLVENSRESEHFALVANHDLPYRGEILSAMRRLPHEYILQPLDSGPVKLPGRDHPVMGAVFKRPAGGAVFDSLDQTIPPVHKDEIWGGYIRPIVDALTMFASRDVTYRSLRPDNLFFADRERRNIILGENFLAPAGYAQPPLFETIQNAVCARYGRSPGGLSDDFYALGVTILFLVLGRHPLPEMSDEEILRLKLEKGSYVTLVGRKRIPFDMKQFLRGLLADDADKRWDQDKIRAWIGGNQSPPSQATAIPRSSWPLRLGGQDYFSCSAVAHGIFLHQEEAMPLITSGDMAQWATNPYLGGERITAVGTVMANYQLNPDGMGDDRWVSKLCLALDPRGPLRFRDLAFAPESIGIVLAGIREDQAKIDNFVKAINSDILLRAMKDRFEIRADFLSINKMVEKVRDYVQGNNFGYGVERCLYTLNRFFPCKSPILKGHFVVHARELLVALDEVAVDVQSGVFPIDKHIAAFIAGRFDADIEPYLRGLSNIDEPATVVLSMIHIFALLQQKFGPDSTPHLATWVAGLTPPVIAQYHDRRTRKLLQERLDEAVETGSLIEILKIIDDPGTREKDRMGYENARQEFASVQNNILSLEKRMRPESQNLTIVGHRIAAIFLATLFIIVMAVSIYIFYLAESS